MGKHKFVILFILALQFGASNHCAFEDLTTLIAKSFFGIHSHSHLPNHLGASSEHSHEDHSKSHQHGQPHPLLIIQVNNIFLQLVKLTIIFFPLALISFFLRNSLVYRYAILRFLLPRTTGDPPSRLIHLLTSSLSNSPQAPPI